MKMIFIGKVSGEKTVLTAGARHTVKAQAGEQYGLVDEVTGLVPDGVEADRSGDDLILRKKEDDTEIRIEGFWEECQPGETQCTAVFNVVGENGQVTEAVLTQDGPVLENFTAGQSGTLSDDDRGGFIWLGGLAFGGGLAAMALAAGGGGGSKHRHENHEADTTAPSAPALTAGDNGSVSVELPDDANKGDTVEITFVNENGDGQKVTLEKGDNGWTSDNSALIPDSQGDTATIAPDTVKDNSEVTAVAKDPAGNESAPVTVTSKTDGVSDAPVLTIPEAADSVNAEELKDGVQAEVTLPAGTVEGAVITLTVTHPDQSTENVTHNVTGDEVTAGKVSMDIPEDAVVDGQNSVRVSLTQGSNPAKAGNTVEIVVDGQVPGDTNGDGVADTTPVVTIPEATGGVNAEELKDGIQAEVTVPAGSAEGDTVTLTVTKPDGKTETVGRELTAKEVEDGKANVTIPADKVATDGEYSVTAEITDPAGNTSGQGQAAEFAVDRVAPSAPALTAGDNGSVSVELPDDANKGDTVEITFVNENGDGQKVTLEKGDNGWTSDNSALIPDSQGDTATIAPDTVKDNSEVTAVAKDPAGNESAPVTVTSKTDGVSDAPVLTIPEAADSVNAEELKDGVQAEVTLPAGTVEGAVITLTVTHPDQSTENVTHNVTGDEVTAGKVSMDIPEDAVVDGQNSVRVSLTQGSNPAKAGNTVEIVVDGQVPGDTNGDGVADTTPVVTIPEATGGVNAEELKDGIQAEVTVPAGSAEGDTVTLTVTKPDGKTETVGRELTAKEVEDGKANVTIPADKVATDGEYSVTAEITDPAGNTSGQGQAAEFAVDRVAPSAPALTAGDNGSVSVELPDDANKGDTVEITFVNENGDGQKVTLEKGDNGWTSDNSALIPDSQGDTATIAPDTVKDNSEVTAVAKDPAGNESAPVTVTSKTDGVSDAPVLTIPEAADSVNAEELKDGVQAEVTLPAGTVEGAVITLTVTHPDQSTENVTHNVTGDEVTAGKVSMDIPEDAVVDGQNSVRVSLTQGSNPAKAGNTVEIVVDGQVPGDTNGDGVADTTPVVTIPEATGGVNAEELKDGIQAEVTVPAGSAEGDTVTLTVTKPDGKTETVGRELTAKEVEDGKANVTIPADKVATDGEYSVTAEITDPAGNTSGQGQAAEFAVDRVAPSAPALTAGDNGSVSVELPDDANKGDTVEITFVNENGDGQKVTLEKGDNGWTSDNSALIPDSQGDTATIAPDTVKDNSEVTAVAKDPAGNESAPVTVTSKTDGVSDAPVLTIPEAADSVNAEELKDGVQAEVTLPAGTVEGAVITLTVTHPDQSTENVTHNVTGDEVTAGKVSMDIPEDAVVDGQNSVRVSLTQGSNPAKAGNTVEIVVDGQVPGDTNGDGVADTTPVVTIPEATGGVNAEELKDGIQAEVTVPAGSAEGDTVTLTVTKPDGKTETVGRELTAKEVEDGKANVTIPADKVATDGEYSVTAEITDPAGNTSGQGQAAEFAVDRVAPSAPALTAGDNGSVSVELPDDANKGDTVEITFVNENGDGQKVTLEKGDNGWTSDNSALIPDSQGDTATIAPDTVKDNSEVTAVAKDPAGNESAPVTVTSKTDGVSDAPVLTIPEAADSVNAEELKDGVQAEVTLPAGTVEGAVITLTVTHPDQSTENVTHNVTGDEVTAGKVSMDIPEDAVVDGQNSVRVSLTQGSNPAKAGNTVEIVVDGQVPGDTNGDGVADTTPVVTIPEATGGVNAEELKDGIQAEVTVPAGSAEGDTVTLTVTKPDGKTETVGRELTAKEVEDGKANVTIPADKVATDGEYSVTAEITDPAGNTSGQGQAAEFAVDRVAPSAPALTAGDNGSVSVELPDDANKGDTVEITFVNENGDGQKVTLEKGDNGWTSDNSALIPDSQGDTATIAPDTVKDNSEVTAVAKDPAGNESAPVTVTSKTDGVSDAPVLTIPEAADSVNAEELKDGVQAEVTLPAGTVEGAVITLTVTHPDQSTENVTHNVTGDEVTAGKVSMDIPEDAVVDGQNSVRVSLTQGSNPAKAGNTVEIVVDGQVPGDTNGDGVADTTPVVTIPEATGGVNAEELKDGIQAEVTVPAGSAEGDTVTLTVTKPDGKTETVGRELTAKEVEDGKANVTIPADKVATDGEYSVTAEITDPAGNTSGQGQAAEFAVDRVAPSAPALTAGDNGSVSVELPDDANKGDTVEITFVNENGDGQKVTLEKGDNGWTSDNSALIPDSQGDTATIAPDTVKDNSEVTAVAKDPAGNESAPVTVTSKTDGVSDAPVLTIPEAADSVNAEELKDGVQAEVTLPAGTVEGAVITLTVTHPDQSTENVTHNVTGDEVTAGKVSMDIPEDAVVDGQNSVRVSLTQGSNPAKAGNTVEIVVDGQVPGDTNGDGVADTTPVVTIPEATGGVNAEELKDGIQAEVTVPAGSAEGDTVTLTVTKPDGKTETVGRELTAKEVEDGKANVTIPADKVATDGEYSVTAEITDPAGNTSGQGQAAEFAVDRVAPSAPALTAGDNGSVSVELPDDANKGDTVEITFVNENGDGQKVTLEKGDNGWTSDNSALIPDSQGDTATIAPDTVKDNSEVTAVAKDPAGNESAPVTVTSKTDGVSDAPVLTIPEAADSVNAEELKDGVQAEVTLPAGTVEGAVITLTVTHPDQSTENVTHNVTGDEVTAGKVSMDIPEDAVVDGQNSVRVSLTQGSNPAKAGNTVEIVVDGQVPGDTNGDGVADTTPVVTIPEATGGVNAEELKDGIQAEVTVPAGSAEGDTVTLTVTKPDGKTETVGRELTAKEVEDGKANVTIPADKVATDGEYSVTAEITDPAGNTSGQGQAAEFAVDRVAPSAPALTAGDNGSVSVELPDDANKGDTVEITFVNENGDGQKVTLEKGDNGWTSDNSALIPDSQGDTATIAPDTVKDNSEVTAVAKDPAGNESAPVTVTSKTDVLPTVSISVETTSLSDDAAMTALASVNGHTENVPATMEDKLDTTGLVYTVSLSAVTSTAVTVKVTLKDGMGYADVSDYSVVDGAQYSGKISLYGDTGQVSYDGKSTVTVVIPAGSERVSFIVDPVLEANQDAFVAEGMERVVATITEASENVTVAADIVDNSGISATGVIYDGNAVALTNLDGDLTLKYALSTSKAPNDQGYTVGVTTEPYDPMLTTDYSDIVYVGYYQSGKETSTYSNLSNSSDGGPDNSKADGNASISTVDLGKGDDIISIRGNLYTSTRVYGGEGKDVITVGGMNEAMRVLYTGSYIFAEAGDDTVVIERTGNQNSGQIYLGSGSDKYTQGDADNKNNTELTGTLDLGSGMKDASNMPEEYLSVYQDGTDTSLGNDTNIDAESDTNTVEIYGSVSGTISGGYGIDNITITKNLTGSVSTGDNTDTLTVNSVYGGATVNMGAGDDTVIVHGALYNATISMGDGDDTLDLTTASLGKSATTTSVRAGENDDVIKLGDISTLSTGKTEIDAGAGDDVIVLTKDYDSGKGLNQGYINGGDGSDTLVLSGNITVRLTSGKYLSEEGITNIEKIDMTTGKDLMPEDAPQTVKLSVSDVIGMNESTTLYISGDASDKVDLGSDDTKSLGGFTKQAQTTTSLALDGTEHTYTLYSSDSGAQVYIDDNIVNANGVI